MNEKTLTMKIISFVSTTILLSQEAAGFEFKLPSFGVPSLQPPSPKVSPKELLLQLEDLISEAPKNGIDTPKDLERQIVSLCEELEPLNPTKAPVRNLEKMNGFWRMRWTNFAPAAPSSGKLGPFVGDVYQDIDLDTPAARNILKVDFPPVAGELFANPEIVSDSTVAITFVSVGNKLAGMLPVGPKIEFETGKEVRLWEHIYLDDEYRILFARRKEDTDNRGFVYVMKRADDERFETNV